MVWLDMTMRALFLASSIVLFLVWFAGTFAILTIQNLKPRRHFYSDENEIKLQGNRFEGNKKVIIINLPPIIPLDMV